MEKIIIIFSLLGDYSGIAKQLEEELSKEKGRELPKEERRGVETACLEKLSRGQLQSLLQESLSEKELLKEELNELYLKYDQMSAAFGEMSQWVYEAALVPGRHFGDKKDEHA